MSDALHDLTATLEAQVRAIELHKRILGNISLFVDQARKLGCTVELTVAFPQITIDLTVANPVIPALPAPEPDPKPLSPRLVAPAKVQPCTDLRDKIRAAIDNRTPAPPPPDMPPPTFKTGDLDDVEVLTVITMHERGANSGEIAKALGRDPRGFHHKVKAVIVENEAEAVQPDPHPSAHEPQPVAVAELVVEPATSSCAPVRYGDLTPSQRIELDRLFNLPRNDPFDLLTDIQIVQALGRGQKLAELALDLGIDAALIKARFALLCPEPTIEKQATVIRLLKLLREGPAGP